MIFGQSSCSLLSDILEGDHVTLLHLIRSSHQLYEEALAMLYRNVEIKVNTSDKHDSRISNPYTQNFLGVFESRPSRARLVRQVKIQWLRRDFQDRCYFPQSIADLLRRLGNLGKIHFAAPDLPGARHKASARTNICATLRAYECKNQSCTSLDLLLELLHVR